MTRRTPPLDRSAVDLMDRIGRLAVAAGAPDASGPAWRVRPERKAKRNLKKCWTKRVGERDSDVSKVGRGSVISSIEGPTDPHQRGGGARCKDDTPRLCGGACGPMSLPSRGRPSAGGSDPWPPRRMLCPLHRKASTRERSPVSINWLAADDCLLRWTALGPRRVESSAQELSAQLTSAV